MIEKTVLSVGVATYPPGPLFVFFESGLWQGLEKKWELKRLIPQIRLLLPGSISEKKRRKKTTTASPSREIYGCPVFPPVFPSLQSFFLRSAKAGLFW